jgi:hypothetical protein
VTGGWFQPRFQKSGNAARSQQKHLSMKALKLFFYAGAVPDAIALLAALLSMTTVLDLPDESKAYAGYWHFLTNICYKIQAL